MSKLIGLALVVLVVLGMAIVMNGVGIEFPGVNAAGAVTTQCYDMLNAAGQVVQTVCP